MITSVLDASDQALVDLSARFRRFAVQQAMPSSPLYSWLALGIAGDRSILSLAGFASSSPVTNLFFGVVHTLFPYTTLFRSDRKSVV